MPAAFAYWCLPEEEARFLEYLSKWEVYAYPPDAYPSISDVKAFPIQTLIKDQNPSQLDFGLKQFLSEKDIGERRLLDGGRGYGVVSLYAHTIGYRGPRYRVGGHLGQSSLSAYWQYLEGGKPVKKNPEFVKWGKKVFAWGRKWASERVTLHGHPYPATPRVKELVEQNKLTVGF